MNIPEAAGNAGVGLQVLETPLPGVLLIKPRIFEDGRGYFFESYREDLLRAAGIQEHFVQDNHSSSVHGVVRGLHYQLSRPQAKLCRVVFGEVFDVAVDIRSGSPHFGKWYGAVLSAENRLALYLPRGFAHGFVVLSERAEFLYKCSDYYDPTDDRGVIWSDPDICIDWRSDNLILSPKDARHPALSRIPEHCLPKFKPSGRVIV